MRSRYYSGLKEFLEAGKRKLGDDMACGATSSEVIYGAPTREAAEAAIDVFADKYGAKYDKAVACLTKDRDTLLAFFDFPAEHWDHLRRLIDLVTQSPG